MRFKDNIVLLIILGLIACRPQSEDEPQSLNSIAADYVKLALHIGEFDEDFVDAYYGPPEWKPEKTEDTTGVFPFEEMKWQTIELISALEGFETEEHDSLEMLRFKYLHRQLVAVKVKLNMIMGDLLPFDVESNALYDAVAPQHGKQYFDTLLKELDLLLPGNGDLSGRYEEFSNAFVIPENKLDTVFKTAIAEARRRTQEHLDLPESEDFRIEYVTDKPWSAYNWYQGNYQSLIQFNTELPVYIERAIDLACHEGYPGHHVYNVMLEKHLVKDRGWQEFSVYLLFSPQSLIAEGTANYGIQVAFPNEERRQFERDVLFPLAGLDPQMVDIYYDIQDVRRKLKYADTEAAKSYLNGEFTREEAARWLVKYNLYSYERALQRTRFFDKYRSYVINYNYGMDLIENYIESRGGVEENQQIRWDLFSEILSSPIIPSALE